MKIRGLIVVAHIALMLAGAAAAKAAEIKVLSAAGFRPVIQDIAPRFERATGHKLAITFASAGAAVKRVQSGEMFDVVIIPRPGVNILVKDGKIDGANTAAIARSGIGVAVRKGAPKPDISSPEALKQALLAAKSITYSRPEDGGASGIHFAKVLDRLGIANDMKAKTVFDNRTNGVGRAVADGGAEIGVHQMQELIAVAGIEIVGPLPGDLQDTIVFSAAVTNSATEPAAARPLIDYLRTPEAAAVIRAKGMDSVHQ
jgi:molybdate transport system substrate-binding protein